MIKEDLLAVGVLGAIAIAGAWFAMRKLGEVLPDTVKEGGEAAYVIGSEIVNTVLHPLDAFGIAPGYNARGVPNWERSIPWGDPVPYGDQEAERNSNDIVSNNAGGINYNLF